MNTKAAPIEVETETGDWARRALLTQLIAFVFIFLGAGAQQLYIGGYLARVTDWSPMQRGMVVAVVYASMMVFRVVNIYLLRGWSDWLMSFVGGITYTLFTLGMLTVFWFKSYAFVMAVAVFWGWGAAAMWAGTTMQVLAATDAAKGRHGAIQGLLYAATDAGWLAGTIILGMINANQALPAWWLYAVAAAVTLVGNVVLWFAPRDNYATPLPTFRDLIEIGTQRKVLISGALQITSALSFGLMLGAFRDYIEGTHGAQYLWITASFYPGIRLVLRFIGGNLADRLGHALTLTLSFGAAAVGMIVAVMWQTVGGAIVSVIALGLLNGAVPVVATAMIGEGADRKRRPLAYSALFVWRDMGVVVAAVWGQVLMGTTGSFALTFQVFAGVFIICGAVALLLQRYAQEKF